MSRKPARVNSIQLSNSKRDGTGSKPYNDTVQHIIDITTNLREVRLIVMCLLIQWLIGKSGFTINTKNNTCVSHSRCNKNFPKKSCYRRPRWQVAWGQQVQQGKYEALMTSSRTQSKHSRGTPATSCIAWAGVDNSLTMAGENKSQ